MWYLFLFISFLYSFLFYAFYTFSNGKDIFLNPVITHYKVTSLSIFDPIIFSDFSNVMIQSFFWNLLYESILFFIIWLVLFFYFNPFDKNLWQNIDENHHENHHKEHSNNHDEEDTKKKISTFTYIIKKFSYYIWFVLFYLSMYFIITSFEIISFWVFILIMNILIFAIFFITNFSNISRDFLRINSIIFSLFYTISYISIIITDINYFNWIDLLNSFLVLLIFPTILYVDKKVWNKDSFDEVVLVHFSTYIFVVFLFYLYFYVFHQNLIFWTSFIATFFWMIWFEILPKINLLKKEKITLRYIWIIFTYIWIIFWIIYISINHSLIILFILLLQSFYNLFIHKKYSNYISLFIWVLLLFYSIYYIVLYYDIVDYRQISFLVLWMFLSFSGVIFTYIYKAKIMLDYYIIHFFCHLLNIVTLIIFLIYCEIDMLKIWILLLLESIYFFLSYYKLSPNWKSDKKLHHKNDHDVHLEWHH